MKNIFVKIAGVVVIVIVLVLVGRNMIAKSAVEGLCRAATGLKLQVGGLDLGLFSPQAEVKNLKLFNPPGFQEKIMFDIPEIYVQYDPGATMGGIPTFNEVRLHVAKLAIERDKNGRLNLDSLKPATGKKSDAERASTSKSTQLYIKTLQVQIDKVVYRDLSVPMPITQEIDLGIKETFHDIKDVRALAPIIVSRALKSSALKSIANLRIGDILSHFQASGIDVSELGLDKIAGMGSGLGSKALETVKGLFGSFSDQ